MDPATPGSHDDLAKANASGRDEPRDLCPGTTRKQCDYPVYSLARQRTGDLDAWDRRRVAHSSDCSLDSLCRLVALVCQRATASTMQPQTTAESARLKVGQKPERRKSTTAPW